MLVRMSATTGLHELGDATASGSLALRASRSAHAEPTRTLATPAGAFRAARRMYLQGRRVDMRRARQRAWDLAGDPVPLDRRSRPAARRRPVVSLRRHLRASQGRPSRARRPRAPAGDLPPTRRSPHRSRAAAHLPTEGDTGRPANPDLTRRRRTIADRRKARRALPRRAASRCVRAADRARRPRLRCRTRDRELHLQRCHRDRRARARARRANRCPTTRVAGHPLQR